MSCDASALLAYPAVQADIRAEHGVHIPLAVESGSRAWGFPSPDSDYDARFVYVRSAARRLTPWPARGLPLRFRSSPRMRGPRLA